MEKTNPISRVAQKVVGSAKPAKTDVKAPVVELKNTPAPAPVMANPAAEMPKPVEDKKGYNLFKNPQGKWELQINRRGGRVSRTIYATEDDAKAVVKLLGLDKK